MRKAMLLVALICFVAVPSMAVAECNPANSPTKVVVTLGGKDIAFCSLKEAYDAAFVNRPGAKSDDLNNRVVPIMMKDFAGGNMFSFYDGFYVIEHTMQVKNANKPYILGFPSRDGAWKWWEKNMDKIGGRVVNFETATREYRKSATGPSKKSLKKEAAAAGHVDYLLKKK
jgi:hypothetical protein